MQVSKRTLFEDALKMLLVSLQKAIEKGDWWTVLEYLGKLGIAISPPVLFTFFLFCGAAPAKVAPRKLINNKAAFRGGFFNPN
ncbi:hypothetical protein [Bacillus velezensis]|uniref:hypothetical protein n=1 Tax=Bacillus velezensis TaxID=492670 RepID=UPI002DB68E0A|nr:hypothetical protein [Bacillus velezensis]MEC3850068.1 hypothetical protein [Bacillus velezensis]